MNSKSKALLILLILGLSGFGIYSQWEEIRTFAVAYNPKKILVVKKISPVKPDFSLMRKGKNDLQDTMEFTFFEVLNDPSMVKFVGLDGSILRKPTWQIKPKVRKVRLQHPADPPKRVEIPKPAEPSKSFSADHLTAAVSLVSVVYPSEKKQDPINGQMEWYAIQVSSFRDLVRAEGLKSALERKGYSAFLKSADIPAKGGIWHRVYIGSYRDRASAASAADRLWREERMNSVVMRLTG